MEKSLFLFHVVNLSFIESFAKFHNSTCWHAEVIIKNNKELKCSKSGWKLSDIFEYVQQIWKNAGSRNKHSSQIQSNMDEPNISVLSDATCPPGHHHNDFMAIVFHEPMFFYIHYALCSSGNLSTLCFLESQQHGSIPGCVQVHQLS